MRQLTHRSLIHKAYQRRTVAQKKFFMTEDLAKLNNEDGKYPCVLMPFLYLCRLINEA